MTTINTYDLEIFVEVAKRKSFTAAADVLGSDKAYLSKVISKLEERFGTKLLNRSTRSLSLTEAGQDFFQRSRGILEALEDTELKLSAKQAEPMGVLKITSGVEFGALAVNKWVADYLSLHPQVRVDYEQTNRVLDIIHEGVDLAIRVGELKDSTLSARRLGEITYSLYAAPSYLRLIAPLKKVSDLEKVDLATFSVYAPTLRLVNGEQEYETKRPPRLVSNGNLPLRTALVSGVGVGLLPDLLAAEEVRQKRLVRVLPNWTRPSAPVSAVFPSNKYLTSKVRCFIDLAVERFPRLSATGVR